MKVLVLGFAVLALSVANAEARCEKASARDAYSAFQDMIQGPLADARTKDPVKDTRFLFPQFESAAVLVSVIGECQFFVKVQADSFSPSEGFLPTVVFVAGMAFDQSASSWKPTAVDYGLASDRQSAWEAAVIKKVIAAAAK